MGEKKSNHTPGTVRQALEITAVYLVMASLLLFLFDNLLSILGSDSEWVQAITPYKGVAFVVITSSILYFVVRGYVEKLRQRQISSGTECDELKAALAELNEKFDTLGRTDPLTGAFNRRYFMERIEDEITRSKRHGHPLSVLSMDVDDFRNINSTYGHRSADEALVAVTQACQGVLRQSDLFARIDARSFSVIMPETTAEQARVTAFKLRKAVANVVVPTSMGVLRVTTSMGGSEWGKDDISAEQILQRADHALDQAKHQGRNVIEIGLVDPAPVASPTDPAG